MGAIVVEDDAVKKYLKAGDIARRVLREASKLVEPGRKLLDICEKVERLIVEYGAAPAFPCNISVNEVAAHYSPLVDDVAVVPEDSLVKIDVGVQVDGFIADTAATLSFNDRLYPLVEAVREALEKALETIKPGARFAETGRAVHDTLKRRGFNPIINLSGHSLARYKVHAGESIPNTAEGFIRGKYVPGKAYAIEPFGTTGIGVVVEGGVVSIYSLVREKLRRRLDEHEARLLAAIRERYRTLPFSERWLTDLISDVGLLREKLGRLSKMGYLAKYPVLVERSGGMVAQFEHTVLITSTGEVIVTTL
ncbi:MAG: type II methionyl aminopeptidase [Thermoproteota archaeon]